MNRNIGIFSNWEIGIDSYNINHTYFDTFYVWTLYFILFEIVDTIVRQSKPNACECSWKSDSYLSACGSTIYTYN